MQAIFRWRPIKLAVLLSGLPVACLFMIFLDWEYDNYAIRRQAHQITANVTKDSARIRAINNWVYHNKGFATNKSYFLVAAFGPTPIQVLAQGGDCADKSRLVAAMLDELGIKAGLVMIAPCLHCAFIHTVVEARYEDGRMVVDPVWNIDYPAGNGGFSGVRDLAWTARGVERLAELQQERGPVDKIAAMPASEAKFEFAVAINWDKNTITRAVSKAIRMLGYEPDMIFRPRALEDPKLMLSCCLCAMAVITMVTSWVVFYIYRTFFDSHRQIAVRSSGLSERQR